ncbi:beta-1,3-galactosyltransferase brn-like [Watersipora subatra]|uniref:beta-1,3-galactosyltransferase brn-like n=1 Tax=Watersipora subatra TaxID=2589382 RepID=UPI00355BE94F
MLTVHPIIPRTVRWIRRHPYLLSIIVLISLYPLYHVIAYLHTIIRPIDIIHDIESIPMSKYSWPLEIDAHKIVEEYRRGSLSVKPITLDNTTITLFPDKKHCQAGCLITVLIKTRVEDRFNRDMLRRTWIQDLQSHNLQHSFLLGQCNNTKCQSALDEELSEHKDIVQANFIDHYYNNTIKFRVGLRYMAYHCNTSRYLFLIDGDYSLNVDRLVQYLKDSNYPRDLFAGKLWPASRPIRDITDPHYLSFEFYPYRWLPPFIAAGANLISVELIEPMDIIAKFTKFVEFDDVFYAMVAKKLGIKLKDESKLIPSWYIPKLKDKESHQKIIGSHRFGNLAEVELIHKMLHER